MKTVQQAYESVQTRFNDPQILKKNNARNKGKAAQVAAAHAKAKKLLAEDAEKQRVEAIKVAKITKLEAEAAAVVAAKKQQEAEAAAAEVDGPDPFGFLPI